MTLLVDLGAVPVARTVAAVLAQDPAPPGQGEEFGKASPVGLVVIVLLGIATILLIRSMTKHLRRVPASFDDPAAAPEQAAPPRDAPSEDHRPPAPAVGASPDR